VHGRLQKGVAARAVSCLDCNDTAAHSHCQLSRDHSEKRPPTFYALTGPLCKLNSPLSSKDPPCPLDSPVPQSASEGGGVKIHANALHGLEGGVNITLLNSSFLRNSAANGGGVRLLGGNTTLDACRMEGNRAGGCTRVQGPATTE
jgi:hypothetical protein